MSIGTFEDAVTVLEQIIELLKTGQTPATVTPLKVVPSATVAPPYDHFAACFAYSIPNEGGYSNDKADSGGPTNWGIIQSEYSKWLKRSVSADEVKNMSIDVAKQIHKAWYYDTLSLGSIASEAIAVSMYDMALPFGIMVSARFAQQSANELGANLKADGNIGPISIEAINQITDVKKFVSTLEGFCVSKFKGIVANNNSQAVFLKGWLSRASRLLTLV